MIIKNKYPVLLLMTVLGLALLPLISYSQADSAAVRQNDNDSIAAAQSDSLVKSKLGEDVFVKADSAGHGVKPMIIDTTESHSVARATWLSTALPGLGQVYNRKYWKVPIIYGALAGMTYLIIDNNQQYKIYLNAFYEIRDSPDQNDRYLGIYDERQLIELQNIYRKWRDLSIIVTGVIYALNVLDAHVDAHLYYYNLDDDLTVSWEPSVTANPMYGPAYGISVKLNFK